MKHTITTILTLCFIHSAHAEFRVWKDASGTHEIKAELVRVESGRVTLKRENGTTLTLPVTSLSKADQALLNGTSTGAAAATGDWPQWRGPRRDDVSTETGLMKKWPKDGPKRLWVSEDAGLGYSGFAITGGKLYTLGLYDTEEKIICLDTATGKKVWEVTIGSIYNNNWGNGPRSTPTVVGGMVYALGGNGDLACVSAVDGKKIWNKSLTKDLGGKLQGWGYTESPLVDDGLVIVTPGGNKGAVAALDAKTGKVKWQTQEVPEPAQYSSPIIAENGGQKQYVQLLMQSIIGISPKDGKLLWKSEFPGRTAVIPTPIYKDGHVFVAAGYGAGCKLVKLSTDGAAEVYANKTMTNHHGGVVLYGNHLYGHSDAGGWTCMDFLTGEEVWKNRGPGKGALTIADGMMYCLSESDGTVVLAEASPKAWNPTSQFKLEAQSSQRKPQGRIWTHPVVAGGRLYLRDQEFISCYDIKG